MKKAVKYKNIPPIRPFLKGLFKGSLIISYQTVRSFASNIKHVEASEYQVLKESKKGTGYFLLKILKIASMQA